MDVNGAYWEIAKQLGYIDEKIYNEGLKVDKKTRLVALGALATNKRRFDFIPEENRYKWIYDDCDKKLRSHFFHIAKRLDILMMRFCEQCEMDGIYFYWVDAFFIANFRASQMIEFFKGYDLDLKKNRIASLNVKKGKTFTEVTAVQKIKELPYWTDIKIKPFININRREYEIKLMTDFVDYVTEMKSKKND